MKVFSGFSKTVLAMALLITSTGWAHGEYSHNEDEHDDTAMMEQSRAEQNEYFEQLKRDMQQGLWASPNSCKYISSIFQPPVANTVTLTFDDGPSTTNTPVVLDVLARYGIKATFFMKGSNAKGKAALLKRIRDEGHLVANHSYSHPNFHTLSQGQQVSEITTTDAIIGSAMSASFKLFRYPYGNSTCSTNANIKKMGYRGIVGWHVDSCDWAFSQTGKVTTKQATLCGVAASNIANYVGHVVSSIRNRGGGIVLMHDIHTRTAYSLEEIIVRLQREGFRFANMDDSRMSAYIR